VGSTCSPSRTLCPRNRRRRQSHARRPGHQPGHHRPRPGSAVPR